MYHSQRLKVARPPQVGGHSKCVTVSRCIPVRHCCFGKTKLKYVTTKASTNEEYRRLLHLSNQAQKVYALLGVDVMYHELQCYSVCITMR